VLAYELGAKLQSSDRKLSLNTAAFYYDYRNKQVRGKLQDPIFGDLEAEVNVPKSRIWGLEADVTVREIPEITITGGITYLNSKVLNYTGVDAVGNPNQNFAGEPLPFTPKWSGSVDIGWRHELGDEAALFAGATVSARTKTDAVFNAENITTSFIAANNPWLWQGSVMPPQRRGDASFRDRRLCHGRCPRGLRFRPRMARDGLGQEPAQQILLDQCDQLDRQRRPSGGHAGDLWCDLRFHLQVNLSQSPRMPALSTGRASCVLHIGPLFRVSWRQPCSATDNT
jgi:hypothetical protein